MRRYLAAAVVLSMASALFALAPGAGAAWAQAPEKRVALVIGNGAYKDSPLKNPVNDARGMAAALKELGFNVIARENATKQQMERAVAEFGQALTPGSVALFYYAGHGMQVNGRNFLVPVDAQITAEQVVRLETLDVDVVIDQLVASGTNVNLMILDACRNNPFERRFRSQDGGLAQINAPKGTLIAYATAPGRVAADGTGSNGLYTSKLVEAIKTPGVPIEEIFKRVRIEVSRETADAQTPWEASSLTGNFYFLGPTTVTVTPPNPADREVVHWQSVKDTIDPAQMRTYLDQYPNGAFAGLAGAKLAAMQRPSPAAAAPGGGVAPTSAYDGTWQGEDGIWRVKVRVAGGRIEGSINCYNKGVWAAKAPAIAGALRPDGIVDAAMFSQKGWAPRRIEGEMPKVRIVGEGDKLNCPNGEVTLKKVN